MKRSLPLPTVSLAVLLALTIVAAVLRFWQLGAMPLFGDEAYYLLWADRLALAYHDHPAGIALLLEASTLLGGREEFGVRWLNALLSVLCVPLIYAVGRRYVSEAGGLIAAAIVAVAPIYVITGRVAYPDSLQYFLLLVNLLIAGRILAADKPDRSAVWLAFGLTLALLLNVKLSSAFYVISLALYALLFRRGLLRERGLWLALGIAALGLLPVLGWNAANDWAMIRWAIFHGQGYGFVQVGLRSTLPHARDYHSPPAALLAGLAVIAAALAPAWGPRGSSTRAAPARADWRLLAVASAGLILPVLLSRADSPRNLGMGLLTLWPLLGLLLPDSAPGEARGPVAKVRPALFAVAALLVLPLALYGAGTTLRLATPVKLPRSSVTESIRRDAAGWPQFAREVALPDGALRFAVDYSIAAQIAYYAGTPVYTAAPQYRRWGVPEAEDLVVFGTGYLDPAPVTAALESDFERVTGPETWRSEEDGVEKTVYTWRAEGRRAAMERVLDNLDYLTLVGR
ncbi:MAG: glycosyltransferase family 39 protein [Anaerolineae bacterium]|nr:glycosyltransferase family 39 protein [Anaerolineae bacterium]